MERRSRRLSPDVAKCDARTEHVGGVTSSFLGNGETQDSIDDIDVKVLPGLLSRIKEEKSEGWCDLQEELEPPSEEAPTPTSSTDGC